MRNVFIAPPLEKLYAPDLEQGLPAITEIDDFLLGRGRRNLEVPKGERKSGGEELGGHSQQETGEPPFFSGLPSGFRLDSPLESDKEAPQGKKLNFSLKGGEIAPQTKGREKRSGIKDTDLLPDSFTGYSNAPLSSGRRSTVSSRVARSLKGGKTSVDVEQYDLTAWAEGIVSRVQEKWIIPASHNLKAKAVVKISVVINRNGETEIVEVTTSSEDTFVDQIALQAINLCAPFPKLPDGFPFKILEIVFEFQCHD